MSRKLPVKKQLERIYANVHLAEIFTDHNIQLVPLPSESYFKGHCPFCELQPISDQPQSDCSLVVSRPQNTFYCFKCQQGGDAIVFITQLNSISPLEAIDYLSAKYDHRISHD
jgi:hypothetical protein